MANREVTEWVAERVRGGRVTSRGFVNIQCLFCPSDKRRPTLGVSRVTGAYYCFRCHTKGRVDVSVVFGGVPVPVQAASEPIHEDKVFERPDGYVPLMDYSRNPSEFLPDPIEFLRGRHIDVGVAEALGVGVCVSGQYAGRLVLPSIRAQGAPWFGYSTRMMFRHADPDIPKYLYPPEMDRGSLFFNHDALFESTHEPVLVVEGGLDALAHWPNGLAMYGGLSNAQYDALLTSQRPVVFVFDGDAWRQAHGLVLRMRMRATHPPVGFVRLEAGFDPDNFTQSELRQAALARVGKTDIPEALRPQ